MTQYCSLCQRQIAPDEARSEGGTWHLRCAQQAQEQAKWLRPKKVPTQGQAKWRAKSRPCRKPRF